MPAAYDRFEVGDQIRLTVLRDPRFKTNRLSFHFILPLSESTASANAMIPFLIRKGYRGCADYTKLNRELGALYGAGLWTDVLKSGDLQIMNVAISTIDDAFALEEEDVSKKAADILFSLICRPAFVEEDFDPSQFELEKQALIDAIEAELNEKTTYAVQRMIAEMCAGEPYGSHKYGTVEAIRALTLSDVIDAYRAMLARARIEVLFVGCGSAEGLAERIREGFSAVRRCPPETVASALHIGSEQVKTFEEHYSVNQAKLVMGFSTSASSAEEMDWARMMSVLYGGTPRSKLFLNVRERLSLCYFCSARFDRTKGVLYVFSGVEKENVERAKEEILRQLDEVRKGNFTEEELEESKRMVADSFKTVNDSPSSMENWYLSQLLLGSFRTPEEEAMLLDRITPEQIAAAADMMKLDTVYVLSGEGTEE